MISENYRQLMRLPAYYVFDTVKDEREQLMRGDDTESRNRRMEYVKNYIKNQLPTHIIASDGKTVRFTNKKTANHIGHDARRNPILVYAVEYLPEALQRGRYEGFEDFYKEASGMSSGFIGFHVYKYRKQIKGMNCLIIVKVGETVSGQREISEFTAYHMGVWY